MNLKKHLLLASLLLYIIFLTIDFLNIYPFMILSLYSKFAGILLCFLSSLLIKENRNDYIDKLLLNLALFFTVIADYILLFGSIKKMGIVVFCFVQVFYIIRHNRKAKVTKKFLIAILLLFCMIIYISLLIHIESVSLQVKVLSTIYSILLLISVISAFRTLCFDYYQKSVSIKVAMGMLLFMLCDLNVAIFNSGSSYSNITGQLIWVFYLPSQVLLTLSGFRDIILLDNWFLKK